MKICTDNHIYTIHKCLVIFQELEDLLTSVKFISATAHIYGYVISKVIVNDIKLLFYVPDTLTAGSYRVEVKAVARRNKSLLSDTLNESITVA